MEFGAWEVTAVTFNDVQVLAAGPLGFRCRIGDQVIYVGRAVPLAGTTLVYRDGDRGRLVLPEWFAEANGLLPDREREQKLAG